MIKLKKETVQVNSQAIKKADYNYDNKVLKLTFVNGRKYAYKNVPRFTFMGMREAHSIGKFINKYIIRKYECEPTR
jgi:hypothetical protein